MAEKTSRYCDFVQHRKGKADNVCGQPVPDDEPTPVTLGTTRYLIDLCAEHQEALKADLLPYTSLAHDTQQRRGTAVRKAIQGKAGAFTTKDVREWLKAQGRPVTDTGRLSNDLIQEYQEAHNG